MQATDKRMQGRAPTCSCTLLLVRVRTMNVGGAGGCVLMRTPRLCCHEQDREIMNNDRHCNERSPAVDTQAGASAATVQ